MTIAIIRISGLVEIPSKVQETLDRLRLRKKFKLVLMNETAENLGMLQIVKNFVAYGKIDKETLAELIKVRGKGIGNKKIKADSEETAAELLKGKKLEDFGLKPFFSLHPPRGGIDSKQHYPKGVLGDNKENIDKLIRRML